MSLVITNGTNLLTIKSVVFDADSNAFFCHEKIDEDPIFTYPLPFNIAEQPDDQFTEKIYLFKNNLLASRRLLKLKLKEKPGDNKLVGYIFSLSALIQNSDIFDNIHLQKIAFNVLKKLLEEKDLSLLAATPAYRSDSAYNLSDFYDEELVAIAICDQFVEFQNYSFTNYLPDLYTYGFRIAPSNDFNPPPSSSQLVINNFNSLQSAITVSAPKNNLHLNYFIQSLIKNDLFLNDNEVARFHLYYQVIEMMLEKVYKNEIKIGILSRFASLSSFDIKENLRETMKETYSLDKLTGGNYTEIETEILEELHLNIDSFLKYVSIEFEANEISRKIYKVRNLLFHAYSKILENPKLVKDTINARLKNVNDSFEYLLIEIISSYKDYSKSVSAVSPVVKLNKRVMGEAKP